MIVIKPRVSYSKKSVNHFRCIVFKVWVETAMPWLLLLYKITCRWIIIIVWKSNVWSVEKGCLSLAINMGKKKSHPWKKEEIMKNQENNWSSCTSYQPRWMEISSLCSPYQPQSLIMVAVLKSFIVDFSPL